jgi:hypothetical protein
MSVSSPARLAGDSLQLAGGIALIGLGMFLLRRMTRIVSALLFSLVVYQIPFVLAMVISVALAWRYWSWLFKEKLS